MRLRGKLQALWVLVAFLSLAGTAQATAPGQPDSGFNGGSATGPSNTKLLTVAPRADGSVVASGTNGARAVVAEFSPTGQLQTSFTAAGPVARAVALQSDGKIVVAGGNSTGGGGMVIERLNPDGTPDSSFGPGGVVTLLASPSGETDGQANAVAIRSDGKILVAGTALGGDGFPRAALVQLNTNGSLDAGFAGRGIDILDLGRYSEANAITFESDGRIVLGGTARANLQATNVIVARVNAAGSLDTTFAGGSGYYAYGFAIGSAVTYVNGVAVQSDGKIIAAGSAGDSSTGSDMIVFRLTSSGSLDSSFGSAGVYRTRATDSIDQYTQSLPAPGGAGVVLVGGKIVVAGYYDSYTITHFALWALSSSGQPDTGFGFGGRVLGPAGSVALAVASVPGGNVVLAGQSGGSGLVARYGAPTPESSPPPPPTPSGATPVVTTGGPTAISATSATLTGSVNPEGLPTTYHFDYGPTSAYGSSTPGSGAGSGFQAQYRSRTVSDAASAPGSLPAGSTAVPVAVVLRGLRPGTTYHYRLVATNPAGTTYGVDRTFRTLPRLRGSVSGVANAYRLAAVLKSGIAIRSSCSQACRIRGSLVVPARVAKRIGIRGASRQVILAQGATKMARPGQRALRLLFTRSAKQHLQGASAFSATLVVNMVPVGGGLPVTVSKSVRLSG